MTEFELAYLGLVVIAFALFSGAMFWGMMTTNAAVPIRDHEAEDPHARHR